METDQWRDISTAPKDQTRFLAWFVPPDDRGKPHVAVCQWVLKAPKEGFWAHTSYGDPTHWMPLPDPPIHQAV